MAKVTNDNSVLYVRCPPGLIDGLDKLVRKMNRRTMGVSVITRADLVRKIASEALDAEGITWRNDAV